MEKNGISPEEYRKLAYPQASEQYFDGNNFDANKWVTLAKKMGTKYMNMVAQHHDGYVLNDEWSSISSISIFIIFEEAPYFLG